MIKLQNLKLYLRYSTLQRIWITQSKGRWSSTWKFHNIIIMQAGKEKKKKKSFLHWNSRQILPDYFANFPQHIWTMHAIIIEHEVL